MDRNNQFIIQKNEMHEEALIKVGKQKSVFFINHENAMVIEQIRKLDESGIDDKALGIAVRKILKEK